MKEFYATISYAEIEIPESNGRKQPLAVLQKGKEELGFAYCPPHQAYFVATSGKQLNSIKRDIQAHTHTMIQIENEDPRRTLVDNLVKEASRASSSPSAAVTDLLDQIMDYTARRN